MGLHWRLNGFTPEELDRVHQSTLQIMERVGVTIEECEEALEILSAAGARVERQDKDAVVQFPADLVEESIKLAPSDVVLRGKTPAHDCSLAFGRVTFATMGELIQIIDRETGDLRPTTQRDSAEIARLCDSIDLVGVMHRPVASLDKPADTYPIYNAESLLANTGKHLLIGPVNTRNLEAIARIAMAHAGGPTTFAERPLFTTIVAPTSPLTLVKDCVEMIITTARLDGGGILCAPAVVGGATSPVTLAGSAVVTNAEALACIVLAQLVRPGTRCIYGNSGAMMDLRTTNYAYGAPEMGVLDAVAAQMAHRYGLPSSVSAFPSSSKETDLQAGHESALNALVAAQAGASIVNGMGTLEFGLTFDYAKFMLDVECARMIQTTLNGVPLTDDQLALDVIAEVGPGGEFLTHDHTFKHMRERSQTLLFDRRSRDTWEAREPANLVARARARAREILATHEPPPIPEAVREEVAEIIAEYLAAR
jgi:trimethylamine--corrinoid protein Co-methyltransferase